MIALVGLVVPGEAQVGHFRTAAGRADYLDAYEQVLQQLPAPSSTTDVPTAYGSVRVYEWSASPSQPVADAAPPVLLLPGRTSGAPMWRDNLPALLGHRRVLAVDALGDAGLSAQTVPITSTADQAAWLDDVLDDVSPGAPVHLVGHSFGGATAAAYARTRPDRVASLALLEPVFTLGSPPASIYLWSALVLLPAPRSWRDEALRRIGGTDEEPRGDLGGRSATADDPLTRMIDVGAEQYTAKLPTPAVLDDTDLARLTMPVYVAIGGAESLAGGRAAARTARTHLPDPTVRVWPGTSHSLPFQVPGELGAELADFWRSADH
ncbi:alpha/beta fold hydrolase [uncultured Pseudokineococcus sp.]|uniref:alpha/beta fold hydrolase n=1 Tax=uncultured Pseudokineococcus sp. TaxID=1642928 RepID=UPI002625C79C|nr:alpha/beta hydrolase [uncultured Pseudokineococcus sp.]